MNDKQIQIAGEWANGAHAVKVQLPVLLFMEDDVHFAYIPALDVSGYGKTEQEAKDSLIICLSEFFRYTTNKQTFELELQRLGWQKRKKIYAASALTDQAKDNEQLREILNDKVYRAERYQVGLPSFA